MVDISQRRFTQPLNEDGTCELRKQS